jgi:hypothetical protein
MKISFDKRFAELDQVFRHLSQFENLESFNVDLHNYKLIEDFISMAENLKQIKRLRVCASKLDQNFVPLIEFKN